MSAKIAAALHQVMSKVGYVQKTGKNAFHGYKYAGEADLLSSLRPAMLEAGLLLLPSVEEVSAIDEHGNTHVRVAYTLIHKDGDVWPEKLWGAGTGGDRAKNGTVGDKGTYKAITGANKYLLFKLFQIETGDDPEVDSDHDNAPPVHKPAPKAAEPIPEDPTLDELRKRVGLMAKAIDGCGSLAALDKVMSNYGMEPNGKPAPDTALYEVWQAKPEGFDFLMKKVAEKRASFNQKQAAE